jgi:hypothetical protein
MSLLLEVSVQSENLEEALDTLAALPFEIDPKIRTAGKRSIVEFLIMGTEGVRQVENSLRARGLLQARVSTYEEALA